MNPAIADLAKRSDAYSEQVAGEILKVYQRWHHPSYKTLDLRRKRTKVSMPTENDTERERAQDSMSLPIVKLNGCKEKVKG